MTILSSIRNRVGLLVGIIFTALLAFVLGDLLNTNSGIFGGSGEDNTVGTINGHEVTIQEYQNKIEQIVPVYLNMDNPKNIDYNWAVNFKGSNVMDLYNKLSPKSKSSVNLAMSKGGFLNKFV